jgi:hypothetical protein
MRSSLDSVQSRTVGLFALAILAFASSNAIQAQQKPTASNQSAPTQTTKPTPIQATSSNVPAIEIKVETFRKQVVAGTSIGVVADITNNSALPVYLQNEDVRVVQLPDVTNFNYAGKFPTEPDPAEGQAQILSLKPKETYRVFFLAGQPEKWYRYISFNPGVYPITVEVKYWDKREFKSDDYHLVFETKSAEYAAPEWVILLGAIVGGLIFIVLSMVRAEQNIAPTASTGPATVAKKVGKTILTLLGSVLMSVIITILLSRIQETQFFIKVTVSDFWGAIAVGFLANYGGWALLDKIVPGARRDGAAGNQIHSTTGPAVTP